MSLERRNPIPPGRYWINVIGAENIRDFIAWVKDMEGSVVIEATSVDSTETPVESFLSGGGNPSTLFAIFRVPEGRAPFLNQPQFGFPSVAPPDIQTESDTVQRPPPEDPEKTIADAVRFVGGVAIGTLAVAILISVLRK